MPFRFRPLAVLGLVAVVSAGCVTGQRPTLGASIDVGGATGTTTGNAAVDQVLRRLESPAASRFTATYTILRKLGPNEATGVVVRDGASTSITVGNVRFLMGRSDATCSLLRKTCEPGTLDARISDYSVGSAFYASGPARALRVTFSRRSGDPVGATASIAGVTAACVRVPVGQGAETYCATPAGPVARWNTAAVDVELTAIGNSADPAAFTPP